MGDGRWGGRASPHVPAARDVGQSYQGETIEKAFSSVPKSGVLGKEVDGEGLPGFKPKEGGSLNNQTKGEKRETPSKVLGDPKHVGGKGFIKTKAESGKSNAETGREPQGEPGVGIKQTGSKGSDPPGIGRRGNAKDGGPGSGPQGGGKGRFDPHEHTDRADTAGRPEPAFEKKGRFDPHEKTDRADPMPGDRRRR